jgi:hypothetical protein
LDIPCGIGEHRHFRAKPPLDTLASRFPKRNQRIRFPDALVLNLKALGDQPAEVAVAAPVAEQ